MRAEVVVQICLSGLWQHLVATERHLWLNLSNIKRNDKNFLMDAPIFPLASGDAVKSVVERFQESAKQAAAIQKLLPRRTHISGAAECEQPQTSKQSVAYHAPLPK